MLMVVPLHKHADPLVGDKQIFERLVRISWPILQRLEQRFRVWIVVAGHRATKRRRNAQRLQSSQHGGYFHRAAIVGLQQYLVRQNGLLVP